MLPLLRFTLDLFESLPAQAPESSEGKRKAPNRRKAPSPDAGNSSVNSNQTQTPPTQPGPYVAGQPLAQVAGRAAFAHPRANRELRLDDAVVAYEFTRARRRTIGFVVGPDGLAVRAPRWTPLYEVEAALQEKARWIVRKLQESQERQRRQESARVSWADGVVLPYLGGRIQVLLDPTHGFKGKGAHLDVATVDAEVQILRVGLPHSATPVQIRDAVQAWLMRQAQALFNERLAHFAPLLGVRWSRMRLSSAGTRWGSASADGSIRLNWRLIHFRPSIIDYVVAHELAHLRVMNHSPLFWDTVSTVVPDYAELRTQLKADAVPQW